MALTDKLTAIADGFRTSRGTTAKLTLDEMAVLAAENVAPPTQEKTVDITENGTTEITADEGYLLSKVTANVNVASSGGGENKLAQRADGSLTEITAADLQGITKIMFWAFYNCTNIGSVEIPDSVTSIGQNAFAGCTNMESLTIPNGVKSLGRYAFSTCKKLKSITIPNTVTTVEGEVFQSCSDLTDVIFEENSQLTSIGGWMFQYCSNLTNINIPNSVTTIGNSAFNGCTSLTSIEIPNGVTDIQNYAFSGCSKLTSINIPNSVTSIGTHVFNGCTKLTSINIPDGIKSITTNMFYACESLTEIDVPENISTIMASAFYKCQNLSAVCIRKEDSIVSLLHTNAFTHTPIYKGTGYVYVPRSLLNEADATSDYRQATNWSTYAAQFRALEDYTVDGTITGELDESKIG